MPFLPPQGYHCIVIRTFNSTVVANPWLLQSTELANQDGNGIVSWGGFHNSVLSPLTIIAASFL